MEGLRSSPVCAFCHSGQSRQRLGEGGTGYIEQGWGLTALHGVFRPRFPPTRDLHCVISPSIKETHTLIHTRVELSLKSLSGRRYPINQLSFRNNYFF